MATICIPIHAIKEKGTYGAEICEHPRSSVKNALRVFLRLPGLLRFINSKLSGERLGVLNQKEASALYKVVSRLHRNLEQMLITCHPNGLAQRFLFGWWYERIKAQTVALSDIVETLAWGSDPELRKFIDSAIHSTERVSV